MGICPAHFPRCACCLQIIIFFVLMMTCFGMWYYYERQLTVHSIKTLRRETFYW